METSERGVEAPGMLESWLVLEMGKGEGAKLGRFGNSTYDGRFVGVDDALLLVEGPPSSCFGVSDGDGGRASENNSVPVEGSPIVLVGTLSPSGSLVEANSTSPPCSIMPFKAELVGAYEFLELLSAPLSDNSGKLGMAFPE